MCALNDIKVDTLLQASIVSPSFYWYQGEIGIIQDFLSLTHTDMEITLSRTMSLRTISTDEYAIILRFKIVQ